MPRLPLESLPFVSKKFARQPKFAVPVGYRHRRVQIRLAWVVLVIVLLFGVAGIAVAIHAKVLTVKHVQVVQLVQTQPMVVPIDKISQQSNKLMGQSLLFVSTGGLAANLTHNYPSVSQVQVEKHYPDTVIISLLPRIASCQLVTNSGTFLVDREGYIFAKAHSDKLPSLTAAARQVQVGQSVSAAGIKLGLALVNRLRSSNPRLVSVVLHDQQLDIELAGPPLILVGQDKSESEVMRDIDQLMAKFQTDNKYPHELDLRFDRPVLRY